EAARALQVERARIALGQEVAGAAEAERYPLAVSDHRVGTIFLEGARQGSAAARRRLLPALASLLGVAIDRERLAREALEAEALGAEADRVEVSFPDDSPTVRADGHQVQRAIVNLIENALKYSPSSEPVHVQVATTPSQILVRVVDRGPGVAANEVERIFEP